MAGTNVGNQLITLRYFDSATTANVNKLGQDVFEPGIYTGGLLTKVSDVSVTLAELTCLISDGDYVVRMEIRTAPNITVAVSTPYVIIRWAYADGVRENYADLLAVASGSIQANDIIVGKCLFTGSTLTGFDYSERTEPKSFANFLKVEPTVTPSMRCRVKSGWCSYGTSLLSIDNQDSPLFTAPTVNPKIDLLYIDNAGALQVSAGVEAASPSAPSHAGKIVLAEVAMTVGMTTITADDITDARPFINLGGSAGSGDVVADTQDITNSDLVAGYYTWTISGGIVTVNGLVVLNGASPQQAVSVPYTVNTTTGVIIFDFTAFGTLSGTYTLSAGITQ